MKTYLEIAAAKLWERANELRKLADEAEAEAEEADARARWEACPFPMTQTKAIDHEMFVRAWDAVAFAMGTVYGGMPVLEGIDEHDARIARQAMVEDLNARPVPATPEVLPE